jgi:hypothetical protein
MRPWLPYLPPALLCLIAVQQVVLSRTQDLTPWKGGGFGMFSTNDGPSRHLEIWVDQPAGEQKLEVFDDYGPITRAASYPSEDRLRALGRKVLTLKRSQGIEVKSVRVIVWRTDFDVKTMEPRLVLIRETIVAP